MSVLEPSWGPESSDPKLTALALLYANGELAGSEAAGFERRLAEDQSAREALCQAVQLTQSLGGQHPPNPSPAYRERVRLGLLRPRGQRRHSGAWLAGAVAATLLLLGGWVVLRSPFDQGLGPTVAQVQKETEPDRRPVPADKTGEMARIWADLHTPEHLERVRADEQRRKHRQEDRRLARGEERPLRGPTQ